MIPGKVCKVAKLAKCPMILGKVCKVAKWQNGEMSYDPWQSMYSGKLGKCSMIPSKVSKVEN